MRKRYVILLFITGSIFLMSLNSEVRERHMELVFPETCVHLLYPSQHPRALLLVFPGYAFSLCDMEKKTSILSLARQSGFLTVIPEMKNSLYADTVFACTSPSLRPQWGAAFTKKRLKPMVDSLLKVYKVPMLIYGLSTGCRGALQAGSGLFRPLGIALVSGDYRFSLDTTDALAIHFMGKYSKNRRRWEQTGNLLPLAGKLTCKVLLATGNKDLVVKPLHSFALAEKLTTKCELYNDSTGGHNRDFWRKADARAMDFYTSLLK